MNTTSTKQAARDWQVIRVDTNRRDNPIGVVDFRLTRDEATRLAKNCNWHFPYTYRAERMR